MDMYSAETLQQVTEPQAAQPKFPLAHQQHGVEFCRVKG